MNIILWDYGSVWPDVWPQNKCRPMWPIFHGPVILSYTSKTIWCMSVIFSDIEAVWPKLWLESKYKSTWPVFHGLVILLNIFKIIWWMNIIVWHNGTVWHIHVDWPYQVYIGQWPIFYGPAILLHILKTIWRRNVVLGIMDQYDSKINLVKYMLVSDLYFMVHWFCLISLRIHARSPGGGLISWYFHRSYGLTVGMPISRILKKRFFFKFPAYLVHCGTLRPKTSWFYGRVDLNSLTRLKLTPSQVQFC